MPRQPRLDAPGALHHVRTELPMPDTNFANYFVRIAEVSMRGNDNFLFLIQQKKRFLKK